MTLGICEPELGATFAQSLLNGGVEKALTVCGVERLDGIGCAGPARVWKLTKVANGEGKIDRNLVDPENNFSLPIHPLEDVAGHATEESARIFIRLLGADNETIDGLNTITDFALVNTPELPVVAGIAEDFKRGVGLVKENIISGKAWEALQRFRQYLYQRKPVE